VSRLNHKRGRPSNYRKTLKSNPDWEKVKRKTRIRDGFKCVICFIKIRLEAHHITYKIKGKSIVGNELEHLEVITTVCEKCHSEIHKNPKHYLNPKNYSKI